MWKTERCWLARKSSFQIQEGIPRKSLATGIKVRSVLVSAKFCRPSRMPKNPPPPRTVFRCMPKCTRARARVFLLPRSFLSSRPASRSRHIFWCTFKFWAVVGSLVSDIFGEEQRTHRVTPAQESCAKVSDMKNERGQVFYATESYSRC